MLSYFLSERKGMLIMSEKTIIESRGVVSLRVDGNDKVVYTNESNNKTGVSWDNIHLTHDLKLPESLNDIAELKVLATIKPKKGMVAEFKKWFRTGGQPVAETQQDRVAQLEAELAALKAEKNPPSSPRIGAESDSSGPTLPDILGEAEKPSKWAEWRSHIQASKRYQDLSDDHKSSVDSWLNQMEMYHMNAYGPASEAINKGLADMGFKVRVKV